ncbi:MAG TPA: methyltransferase domain-containing protein [Solirubrobacteraceae bacterium]|nr:methyltransferase domain-containing protein [Solirubrobacteraceae bacterium]
MAVREWDGPRYDRLAGPQTQMGLRVLERLDLAGDECVIDAGCGSGRITAALVRRVPRGRVIGVDASPSMIEMARSRLGPDVDLRVCDLLELDVGEPVDAVLSTATFHWISDHERLFARLRRALRPGGRLVAQCGGEGNIARVRDAAGAVAQREPYAAHLAVWVDPREYAGAEQTEARLLGAGFSYASCWLAPVDAQLREPREFLQTIVLAPQLDALPEDLRERYLDDVLARLGRRVVADYVRLNIDAVA